MKKIILVIFSTLICLMIGLVIYTYKPDYRIVAQDTNDISEGIKAVEKIADQYELLNVAKSARLQEVQFAAFNKLTFPGIQYWKNAFEVIPEINRLEVIVKFLPLIDFLSNKEIVSALGQIVSLEAIWDTTKQDYGHVTNYDDRFKPIVSHEKTILGFYFQCDIVLNNLPKRITIASWPEFLEKIGSDYVPDSMPTIKTEALFEPFIQEISQQLLEKIILSPDRLFVHNIYENPNETVSNCVRKLAVKFLTDQVLLDKIAMQNKFVEEVRLAAIDKLTDEKLLQKFVTRDSSQAIREHAQKKLEDLKIPK